MKALRILALGLLTAGCLSTLEYQGAVQTVVSAAIGQLETAAAPFRPKFITGLNVVGPLPTNQGE